MPTLMSKETFALLTMARNDMKNDGLEPAGIFVPWIGDVVRSGKGGIYYVGIATDQEFSKENYTFEECYKTVCSEKSAYKKGTYFWRFLGGLTNRLLGDLPTDTADRWGWSNLMKIGSVKDRPTEQMCDIQKEACEAAFSEELSNLRNTLIVVASKEHFGMLDPPIVQKMPWLPIDSDKWGYTYAWHEGAKNLYVHIDHPNYIMRQPSPDALMNKIMRQAMDHFTWPGHARPE